MEHTKEPWVAQHYGTNGSGNIIADMLYQVQLAVLNVEQSIERHAELALAQVQVEAWQASRHIDLLLEGYKAADAFRKIRGCADE